jgi:hypothetical protein
MAWKEEIAEWWERRKLERRAEESGQDEIPVPRPYPYLNCTSDYHRPDAQFVIPPGGGTLKLTVWNEGNFPAWTCYVEVREGSGPLSDFELRGQTIITLQPGERRDVMLQVVPEQVGAHLVGVCYDPLLDPMDFGDPSSRHITARFRLWAH